MRRLCRDYARDERAVAGVRQNASARSAELNSAVSRICNPPAAVIGGGVGNVSGLPNAIRRYSRLKICATKNSVPHLAAAIILDENREPACIKSCSQKLSQKKTCTPPCMHCGLLTVGGTLCAPCKPKPMNPSQDDADTTNLWRLTAEQRRQIYEEEKRRIEHTTPTFSKRTWIIAAVYLLGCLLLFFGITNAVMDFWSTHTWNLKPESDFFESLIEAAVTLIRPFLAVVLTFWAVVIPPAIVWGLWLWGADIPRFLKRLVNRDDRDDN
jgi:hypothetical protein